MNLKITACGTAGCGGLGTSSDANTKANPLQIPAETLISNLVGFASQMGSRSPEQLNLHSGALAAALHRSGSIFDLDLRRQLGELLNYLKEVFARALPLTGENATRARDTALEQISGPLKFIFSNPKLAQAVLTVHPGKINNKDQQTFSRNCTLFYTAPAQLGANRESINLSLVFNSKEFQLTDFEFHLNDALGETQTFRANDFSDPAKILGELKTLYVLAGNSVL